MVALAQVQTYQAKRQEAAEFGTAFEWFRCKPCRAVRRTCRGWRRRNGVGWPHPLYEAGLLSLADRAALAAYCQAYGRWVEAEERLKDTPTLLKTPSGYAQQSPWLTVANKQLELMGRYMSELGLTPVARTRLAADLPDGSRAPLSIRVVYGQEEDGAPLEDGEIVVDGRL